MNKNSEKNINYFVSKGIFLLVMTKKNTFRFAAFTAAALGLGLLVSGCGDGGSTTPNPLNGRLGTVIYNYNVLAKAAARADVDASIASVQYSFDGELTKNYSFEHKDTDKELDLSIYNVDSDIQTVTAAYYDADGNLLAVGVDKLNWVDKVATVTDPQIIMLGEDPTFDFSASEHVIAPNDTTEFSVVVVPSDYAGEAIDVTDFATFNGIDSKVLAPVIGGTYGEYCGVEYGIVKSTEAYAEIAGVKVNLDADIYVTDQTPSKIGLLPADTEITVTEGQTAAENSVCMFYAADDTVSFGLEKITLKNSDGISSVVPFNKMALKVAALEYTNEDGKGPQPVIAGGVDITDDPNVKIAIAPNTPEVESKATIKDKTVELSGIVSETGSDLYRATASYNDSEEIVGELMISAAAPKSNLAFASESEFVPEITEVGTYDFTVMGKVFIDDLTSAPIDVPETVIAADAYPDVKALVGAEDYVTLYKQVDGGKNGYTLEVKAIPADDTFDLELAEETKPAFSASVLKQGE
ncbi:MAG: hypothetical protein ACI376_08120 [Candidatus Bruticola sp.]